jgi:hypothetical protein
MLSAGYGGMILWPNVSKKLLTDTGRGKTHPPHVRDAALILQDFCRSDTVG